LTAASLDMVTGPIEHGLKMLCGTGIAGDPMSSTLNYVVRI